MSITVREALELGILPKARVIAGHGGLDRPIRYVDIMEVPDPDKYFRSGLLLVSSWYAIHDNEEAQCRLVKAAADADAAGFALKVERYLGQVCQRVIDLADECQLPIIEIIGDVPYIEITHPLLTKILNDQAFRLEYYLKAHKLFHRVALEGGDYGAIAQTLYSLIHNPAIICNAEGRLLAWFSKGEIDWSSFEMGMIVLDETDISYLSYVDHYVYRSLGSGMSQFLVFPIRIEADTYGYWLINEINSPCTELDFIALENASTIAALEATKRAAIAEVEHHLRHDFVDDLIRGDLASEEVAKSRASALGWEFTPPVVVIVADIDGFGAIVESRQDEEYAKEVKSRMLAATQSAIALHSRSFIVINRSDSCVAIARVPFSDRHKKKTAIWVLDVLTRLQADLKTELDDISVSIAASQLCWRLLDVGSGYREASELMRISRIVSGPGQVATKEKLDTYRLFYRCGRQEGMREFCQELLGPLSKADAESCTDLVHTLRLYLENGASVKKTAQSLFIHENTLRYRLKKAERITGLDLRNPTNRFKLALALHISPFSANE